MKKIGIRGRLLFAVFVIIAVAAVMFGYMGLTITKEFVNDRFDERISSLARHLARNAELGILIDNRSMLKKLAENLVSERDIVGVWICDADNNELAAAVKGESSQTFIVEEPVTIRLDEEENRAFGIVPDQAVTQIGHVRIACSKEGIRNLMETMRLRFILISVIPAGLALIVFYILSRSLLAPITELVETAQTIAGGNREMRVHPGTIPEIRKLGVSFNVMLDSLDRNRRALQHAQVQMMKQKTLAETGKMSMIIAHEIKNPISIIKSTLDVLKKDIDGACDPTMIEYIDEEILRLNRLIEDFLMFARPGQPRFKETEVDVLVETVVARFQIQMSQQTTDIHLTGECPAGRVSVDHDLITRALDNVIKNACEAAGESGAIWVRSVCDKDNAVITVEDSGDGIADEHRDMIFEPFYTLKTRGTGLGLAYARQVVEAHGGTISADNSPQGGALFTITLPLAETDSGNFQDHDGAKT